MSLTKWIFGALGFALHGPIGAVVGVLIGSLFDGGSRPTISGNGRNYDDGCAIYGGEAKQYSDRLFLWTAYAGKYSPNVLQRYDYIPLRILVENNYVNGGLRAYVPTAGTGAFGKDGMGIRSKRIIGSAVFKEGTGTGKINFYHDESSFSNLIFTT